MAHDRKLLFFILAFCHINSLLAQPVRIACARVHDIERDIKIGFYIRKGKRFIPRALLLARGENTQWYIITPAKSILRGNIIIT